MNPQPVPVATDPTVNRLINSFGNYVGHPALTPLLQKFATRAEFGFKKYGTTTDANPLTLVQWLVHLQEELMDALVYSERIQRDVTDDALIDYMEKTKNFLLFVTYSILHLEGTV
jgi:hypothetical protein